VFRLLQMAYEQVEIELVVEHAERGDVRLDRQIAIERRLTEGMVADARQARFFWICRVAAESLGEHVTDLQVLGLLGRPEREKKLSVHAERAGFQAKTNQQRRAFRQAGIDTPGAPAPGAARRLARGLVVAGGIEAVPRDVGLRIPVQALALAVELAERRPFRGDLP